MSLPPDAIEPGKCYLVETEQHRWVRLVTHVTPDGQVRFENREVGPHRVFIWFGGVAPLRSFAAAALREVPCEWMPTSNEA